MYFELFKDIKNDDINMTILKKIIYKFIYECIKKIYYSFSFIVAFSKPNKPLKYYFQIYSKKNIGFLPGEIFLTC